jgi:hypothetical protein
MVDVEIWGFHTGVFPIRLDRLRLQTVPLESGGASDLG